MVADLYHRHFSHQPFLRNSMINYVVLKRTDNMTGYKVIKTSNNNNGKRGCLMGKRVDLPVTLILAIFVIRVDRQNFCLGIREVSPEFYNKFFVVRVPLSWEFVDITTNSNILLHFCRFLPLVVLLSCLAFIRLFLY